MSMNDRLRELVRVLGGSPDAGNDFDPLTTEWFKECEAFARAELEKD